VIASQAAVADHKDPGSMEMTGLDVLEGAKGLAGTGPSFAVVVFSGEVLSARFLLII